MTHEEIMEAARSMGRAARWTIREEARQLGMMMLPARPGITVSSGLYRETFDFPAEDLSVLDPGEAEYIAERKKRETAP